MKKALLIIFSFVFIFVACDVSLFFDNEKKTSSVFVPPIVVPKPEPDAPQDTSMLNFESASLYYNDVVEKWAYRTFPETEKLRLEDYKNQTFSVKCFYNCSYCSNSTSINIQRKYLPDGYSSSPYGYSLTISPMSQTNNDYINYKKVNSILSKSEFLSDRFYLKEKKVEISSVIENNKHETSDHWDSFSEKIQNYNMLFSNSINYTHYYHRDNVHSLPVATGDPSQYAPCSGYYQASPSSLTFNLSGYYHEKEIQEIKNYIKFNKTEYMLKNNFSIIEESVFINTDYIDSFDIVSPQKIVFYFKPDTNWKEKFLIVKGNILSFSYKDKVDDSSFGYALTVK